MTDEELKKSINYREQTDSCLTCKFMKIDTDHRNFYDHVCNNKESQQMDVTQTSVCNNYARLTDKTCACILCANRSDCMPGYDDETLINGAGEHTPILEEECNRYTPGNESTRLQALKERDECNRYARNLIRTKALFHKLTGEQ